MALTIPSRLVAHCQTPASLAWLERLPAAVSNLERRWSLTLGEPFNNGTSAWVTPVTRADGTTAVLKLGMPHMEGEQEMPGLRFWAGDPTVRLLDADAEFDAMLLEHCVPGTALRALPEGEQDEVIAGLLTRLWRSPSPAHSFRPLAVMLDSWRDETLADVDQWRDAGLVREGLRLFEDLSRAAATDVLLATDLHAGNVLRAERRPWLVIDPKPFLGDPAYDVTQHLLNCKARLLADPTGTIGRLADMLSLDRDRIRLWTFARAAAEPQDWQDGDSAVLARALAKL